MKINLCCGQDYREGYVNVDFASMSSDMSPIKPDVVHNIKSGLPFEDNSADEIIFREALEHFNRWDGLEVLKEIHRVLKPGGKLDLTVPLAEKQIRILLTQIARETTMDDFFRAHEKFSMWKFVDDLAGATHRTFINGVDLGDGDSHKCFYTPQTLRTILTYVGFTVDSVDQGIQVWAHK